MAVVEALKRIGCVSEFEERDISAAELAVIVKAAAWAPSAANAQPWEIVAVRDKERKVDLVCTLLDSHLRPRLGGDERRDWLAQAPVILVVCLDRLRAKARYGEIGENLFGSLIHPVWRTWLLLPGIRFQRVIGQTRTAPSGNCAIWSGLMLLVI